MIPKIIHYCWFGGNPIPEKEQRCIESWKKFCPDFEIQEWNENNFDISCNSYVAEAYQARKYAFVSDFVRLWALAQYGGIYLDTDVELCQSIEPLLSHRAFSGFEDDSHIPTAIMGSEPHHPWIEMLLKYYDEKHFVLQDGTLDTTTNVTTITKLTSDHYSISLNNTFQEPEQGFVLYPTEYFCPKDHKTGLLRKTKNTVAIHHFAGSWISEEEKMQHSKYQKAVRLFGPKYGEYLYVLQNVLQAEGVSGVIKRVKKKL